MAYNDKYWYNPFPSTTVCPVCRTELGDTDEGVCSEACQQVAELLQEASYV